MDSFLFRSLRAGPRELLYRGVDLWSENTRLLRHIAADVSQRASLLRSGWVSGELCVSFGCYIIRGVREVFGATLR